MRYIPNDNKTILSMLETIGVQDISDLFKEIPVSLYLKELLNIDPPAHEEKLFSELKKRAEQSKTNCISFLGAGSYRRFIPRVINALTSRAEFLTAYTPYQPEVSQGTLQAMFEFQTLISQLTGMDLANSSLYEGASSVAEAVLMAKRLNPKATKVLLSAGLHPEYVATVKTYCAYQELEIKEIPLNDKGQTDYDKLREELDEKALCSVLQAVNFYGIIENQELHGDLLGNTKAINIIAVGEMSSLGLLAPPGKFGADIVVGEAQSIGLPVSYGGPYLGILATKQKYIRQIPGRIAGQTVDKAGKTAYCLTLSTREQHIRREKATSNICSNQMLCALSVTIYLSLLGKQGLGELAELNYSKTKYAYDEISRLAQYQIRYQQPVYNEFVVELPMESSAFLEKMKEKKILAGVALSQFDTSDTQSVLLNFTELNSREEIDILVESMKEVAA